MTGVTLYLWWLTAIVILICGIVLSKKFSNNIVLIGCVILAVIIVIMGIRFKADMKKNEIEENQTNETSDSVKWEDTYSDVEDKKNNDIDSDYLEELLNVDNQQYPEEIVKEEYSEYRYEDDMPEVNRSASEYIIKDSNIRYLSEEDLQGLSADWQEMKSMQEMAESLKMRNC